MKRLLCFGNDRLRYGICMFSAVMITEIFLCVVFDFRDKWKKICNE